MRRIRFTGNVGGMDIYDAALKRLKADCRSLGFLSKEIGLPIQTINDIQNGVTKNPRLNTLRPIAAYYFPKSVSA